jgi:hypothetical protein
LKFVASLHQARLIDIATIVERLEQTNLPSGSMDRIKAFLSRLAHG